MAIAIIVYVALGVAFIGGLLWFVGGAGQRAIPADARSEGVRVNRED